MEEIIESLKRYEEHRVPCGAFLSAVLENDLVNALGRANPLNLNRIHEIVMHIYHELPGNIWGSPEKVKEHLSRE